MTAATNTPRYFDTVILGAGASGLMCAITAARRGRKVLVLEKSNKIGKKILMSGGGKCNFTNYDVQPDNFISNNPHFCKSALKRYSQWDFIALVEQHSIAYEERKHGQLFCLNSAKDILNMLLKECELAGVEIKTRCAVNAIKTLNTDKLSNDSTDEELVKETLSRYRVVVNYKEQSQVFDCNSLVVATGALSIPTLGGSDYAYDIATQFGLPLIERRAGLVPFMFSDAIKPICERLSGLALETTISCNKHEFTENILFTHRGISGPAILQISNYWVPGNEISINLLPMINASEWLIETKHQYKGLLKNALSQHFAKSLVNELENLWWPNAKDKPLAEFTDQQLSTIGKQINHWRLKPSATEGYRTAEVTLGGIDTDSISSKTMAAKQHPGLYFIGEAMDVTGHLGGYNFQWAWSSGYTAGMFV
ncbi:MAG: aminoacetone oxidase family FAD-binding enzyme [SAR86 cluster bacterium]|uniref:Aminoacetone oxidase family FAD-binding enzyme n=1 Tax=SAR86 cluster bacterium TaxID=2030880 RepID=A0A2A5CJ33_9GAMM|nr:NAD(P)/FAD-dependent oxidoreductase [Gammaproteobacteria bacterium AH-315-E17]PCJ43511.1 MAG: aminoacetone oxidase family FAD-binding enzyme [SAR86 cluster bacterium]